VKSLIAGLFKRKSLNVYEERAQGFKAKALWENADFQRCIDKVRCGIFEKWAASPVNDAEGQMKLRLMLKLLDDIEGNIKQEMADGAFADRIIKEDEAKKERASTIQAIRR
jgi:hypothetical protein